MPKYQQVEGDSFLELVEELVRGLGCLLRLKNDINCCNWCKYYQVSLKHWITESSYSLWLLLSVLK